MEFSTCVRAFVCNPKGEILLIKHKEDLPWTLPWWHVEQDEELDIALLRELKEEFDLSVRFEGESYQAAENFIRVQPLPLTIHTICYEKSNGRLVTKQELFYKVWTDQDISYQQDSEIFAWKWRSVEEILDSRHGIIYPNIKNIVSQYF